MKKGVTMKYIKEQDLYTLQEDYKNAVEKNQPWIVQAMDKVFDEIDQGKILVEYAK